MEINFRIDGARLRKDLNEKLENPIKRLKDLPTSTRTAINQKLVAYIMADVPEDSGALKWAIPNVESRKRPGVFRSGRRQVSDKIFIDAVEHREPREVHYASFVLGSLLGIDGYVTGWAIQSKMRRNGDWDAFIAECKKIMVEAMKNG